MTTTKTYVAKSLGCLVGTFVENLDHDSLLAYCREYEVDTDFNTTTGDMWPEYTNEVMVELEAAMFKAYTQDIIKDSGLVVALKRIFKLDYTRAAVNLCALDAHEIARVALSAVHPEGGKT